MSASSEYTQRELYGGAMVCITPKRFTDMSKFKKISDTQEQFADGFTDQSIIIELVERLDVSDEQAARAHWIEIAAVNESKTNEITQQGAFSANEVPALSDAGIDFVGYCIGKQRVSKGRDSEDKSNVLDLHLTVLRSRKVSSDILISFNVPTYIAPGSQSQGSAFTSTEENQAVLRTVLQSFAVKNWGVFGPEHA